MASTYLTNTNPTAGNRTKGTISCWFKRSGLSSNQWIYSERLNSTDYAGVRINSGDNIGIFSYNGGSAEIDANTNAKFRDTNGWYHFVANWDTSLATASDRVKIWINGELQSFSGSPSYPSQNSNTKFGIGSPSGINYDITIGRRGDDAEYFDGSMAHYHRVDNQTLAPTVFGETDSTTGEWKINTSPSITYTGSSSFNFFVLKDGNSVTDQSGNSNNFTVGGGTLTKTEDNPSNVFCTLNPLVYTPNPPTFSNGNTKFVKSTTGIGHGSDTIGTLGAKSGKYYFEMKTVTSTSFYVGIIGNNHNNANSNGDIGGSNIHTVNPDNTYGDNVNNNGTTTSITLSYSANDIFGLAFDLDNGKWYFHINGTYFNSGDPTSGSTGTGSMGNITTGELFYLPFAGGGSYNHQHTFEFNFGNGYFGSTQISSAGTNASGNGIFEYDVPTGYTALSTKGLNS